MLRSDVDANRPDHLQAMITNQAIVNLALAMSVVVLGCGPDAPNENEPPGVLEYETPSTLFYRLDRRIDMVGVDPMVDRSGCGYLNDRAYDDLTRTLGALDPSVDYGWADCFADYQPEPLFHLNGFTYGPFPCEWRCCHEDLIWAAVVYWAAGSNLYDQSLNIEGEIYDALEPDTLCPD